MDPSRFREITQSYGAKRVAVIGDVCLDRYLEIDPRRTETSIETGLPVHNVVNVRNQPGGAGTIINNLSALGVAEIWPISFAGTDGEGFELIQALRKVPQVNVEFFRQTGSRRTFTYTKPLVCHLDRVPEELSRLDHKNWLPTPSSVEDQLIEDVRLAASRADALILLDQVDLPGTGVLTQRVLAAIGHENARRPGLVVLADSRNGFKSYPPVSFKMNRREFCAWFGQGEDLEANALEASMISVARRFGRPLFVTLAESGLKAAGPTGELVSVPACAVRGPIDIVGAGDSVTANLTAALLGKATLHEALQLAAAGSSVVIHQLGTTGVARVVDLEQTLFPKV